MFPGLSEADCQVAASHYRQLVSEGQRQRNLASVHPTPAAIRPVSTTIRQQLGMLLLRTGQHLLGTHAGARDAVASGATA